jgi:hypothetical protein
VTCESLPFDPLPNTCFRILSSASCIPLASSTRRKVMQVVPSTTHGITMPRAVPRIHKQCRNLKARWWSFSTLSSCHKHFFLDNQEHHPSSRENSYYIITTHTLFPHHPIHTHSYKSSSFETNNQLPHQQPTQFNPPAIPFPFPSYSNQPNATMCRARLTTYLLCGCIHKHQDFCSHVLEASTKVEWDAVHVCSDWDSISTQVHESVSKRCPLHAKEFLERGGGAAAARG